MKQSPLVRNLLNGLTFGAVIGVGLYLFHSPAEYTTREHLISLFVAAVMALLTGVILGLIFHLAETLRMRRFNGFRAELKSRGELLREEKATRSLRGVGVGGHLFLTDSALVFRPFRSDGEECVLDRSLIETVQITDPRRCMITVTLKDGGRETFTVTDPREWFDLLGQEDAASPDSQVE